MGNSCNKTNSTSTVEPPFFDFFYVLKLKPEVKEQEQKEQEDKEEEQKNQDQEEDKEEEQKNQDQEEDKEEEIVKSLLHVTYIESLSMYSITISHPVTFKNTVLNWKSNPDELISGLFSYLEKIIETMDLKDIHTINLVTNYGFNQTFNKEKIYFELSNHLKFIKRITMDYETVP